MVAQLRKILGDVKENESLAPYTTFKIGGPARYFFTARSADDIVKAVEAAVGLHLPYFILGGGSNILVADQGFNGLVIKIHNSRFQIHDLKIIAGAGVPLGILVQASVEQGLAGLEWGIGIPGTIGGAVRGNAGAFGGEMKDVVEKVNALSVRDNLLEIKKLASEECQFGYRDSVFKHDRNLVILEVELALTQSVKEGLVSKMRDFLKHRSSSQSKEPSAGCIFKNLKFKTKDGGFLIDDQPVPDSLLKALPQQFKERQVIPVRWLLEYLGLAGKSMGKVKISPIHCNFIVNTGKARAQDCLDLMNLIKDTTLRNFGFKLTEEVELVGFLDKK